MVKLLETRIFSDDCPDSVLYGDIITEQGIPLRISRIIQRRWGWTGKAARLAEQVLRGGDGEEIPLELADPLIQQLHLFAVEPEILWALLGGLRLSSSKNAYDAHRLIDGINISFSDPITDEGLVSTLIKGVAARLGTSSDEIREATEFTNDDGKLRLNIDNYAHDLS